MSDLLSVKIQKSQAVEFFKAALTFAEGRPETLFEMCTCENVMVLLAHDDHDSFTTQDSAIGVSVMIRVPIVKA